MKTALDREILLAFWKVHILHHASMQAIYGLWMIEELAEHGYQISPGTLYPLLSRMTERGWLRAEAGEGKKGRRLYHITDEGRQILGQLREMLIELHREVVLEHQPKEEKS